MYTHTPTMLPLTQMASSMVLGTWYLLRIRIVMPFIQGAAEHVSGSVSLTHKLESK
jgi:hypothetical protein